MAILKMGSIVTAISGKIGGHVFGQSSQGQYMKNNSYGNQPQTQLNSSAIQSTSYVNNLWRTLSTTEQNTWKAAVGDYPYINGVGETVYYTGYQLFLYLNQNLFSIQGTLLATAPSFVTAANMNLSNLYLDATTFNVDYSSAFTTFTYIFFCAPNIDPGVNPKDSDYRLFVQRASISGSGSLSLITQFNNVFGDVVPGQITWLKCKAMVTNNGNVTGFNTPLFATAV